MAKGRVNRVERNKSRPEDLVVLRSLEVGPVKLEPNRLSAPYKVVTLSGEAAETRLIYRYQEDVFSGQDRVSAGLDTLVAAQVALNYGLFCREIRFRGAFDTLSRRFIKDMAQNTAREIFVKKFLEPNPFLVGWSPRPKEARRESYLNAELRFDDPVESGQAAAGEGYRPAPSPQRYAVLSSGGKESLLSFGLLRELGCGVIPIFVNESGRHWFTALNAYRHFSANIPETSKVWTNADRVFNWMLKHLPFVRKDHAKIRSDEYPIRLWTVAVFLFGALPLVFAKGCRFLVVGDEYDTTRRASFRGIPHYDGLYDQSRYFDEALTRFFHRKGWGISQFSILRPLSELLVQKILYERYPDLQRLQTSCHAARRQREGVRPCGRCEKCRRVVGMLLAVGGDPGTCGYDQRQTSDCLRMLVAGGAHQEARVVEHTGFLLRSSGRIQAEGLGRVRARQRPEVLGIRFDPERSPVDLMPVELREPLLRIWMSHASGVWLKSGRRWIDFDPLKDPSFSRPYRFDHPRGGAPASRPTAALPHRMGELTWPEAEARLKEVDVALLPVGALEQHGPHLPLDTDSFDAEYLAEAVARACSDPKPLVLPLVAYGVSYHHEGFKGTVAISPDTLSRLAYEIGMSVARQGITKLVIINGHGGNSPSLHFAAQKINRDARIFTCVDTGETSDPDIYALVDTPNDVHAGEIETSTALAARPALVRREKIKRFVPEFSSRYLNFSSRRSIGWYAHTASISTTGVLGDPTKATKEKGERMWELMIRHLVALIEDLKRLSLDEIHQKRY